MIDHIVIIIFERGSMSNNVIFVPPIRASRVRGKILTTLLLQLVCTVSSSNRVVIQMVCGCVTWFFYHRTWLYSCTVSYRVAIVSKCRPDRVFYSLLEF